MLLSRFYSPLVKETPADAELVSHQLMIRAGLVRKLASGCYSWLPLGLKVLRKVETIIREEMAAVGAQECLLPILQPAELWQESGRWDKYGKELMRLEDRHSRAFSLGPTHEEVLVDLVRGEIKSYKQLPLTLYQIQTKFRDEIRPRFGVMRGREFLMKDAYSFHIDKASLQATYDAMHQAYMNIFTRLGLNFRSVLADSGSIGGELSHEFQVLAQSGEDVIAYSDESDYAANLERAEALVNDTRPVATENIEKFATPDVKTIEDLERQFNISPDQCVKTLIVKGDEAALIALVLRGDHMLNELKTQKLPGVATPLTLVPEEEVKAALGVGVGSLGPVGLSIPCIVDHAAAALADFVCGANEAGYHYRGANWGRDVVLGDVADLRDVCEGDSSPDGHGTLQFARGIEVGHIFQLGDIYTKALSMSVLSDAGKAVTPLMGCYGIGVSRVVAAAIEQNHDDRGICWPAPMAPFQVAILPLNMHKSYRVKAFAEALYQHYLSQGIEVIMDDRKERPGVMFSTADLMGIPHRIVIGERGLDEGTVEYKRRDSDEVEHITLEAAKALRCELVT